MDVIIILLKLTRSKKAKETRSKKAKEIRSFNINIKLIF